MEIMPSDIKNVAGVMAIRFVGFFCTFVLLALEEDESRLPCGKSGQ